MHYHDYLRNKMSEIKCLFIRLALKQVICKITIYTLNISYLANIYDFPFVMRRACHKKNI